MRELFAGFGPVVVRRMFGGAGIYAHGRMFGLVHDGVIYLKAGNAAAFEREKLPPFTYSTSSGKRGVMSIGACPIGSTTIRWACALGARCARGCGAKCAKGATVRAATSKKGRSRT